MTATWQLPALESKIRSSSSGLNAYADPIKVMVHQSDCEGGTDMRFEVTR
jgi:hypothetical protein